MSRIDEEVLEVLQHSTYRGNRLQLAGQLDRPLYVKVNKVIEALGGKWQRICASHVFEGDAFDALEGALESGQYVDPKTYYGFFETPDDLADQVVRMAKLERDMIVLEPSVGSGQLVRAIDRAFPLGDDPETSYQVEVFGVEIQDKFRETLFGLAVDCHFGDFLLWNDKTRFDRVVMNPPFARQADIDHVCRAWTFLKPGGRLVAIMSAGWCFRENAKSQQFRDFVGAHGDFIRNPEDSFKASGTSVSTVTVVLEK